MELNQFDAAMADLNKAIELKADDPRTLERRGYLYYKQKNYEAALADYNKALEKNPTSTLALNRRADTYVALNRYQEAKADSRPFWRRGRRISQRRTICAT